MYSHILLFRALKLMHVRQADIKYFTTPDTEQKQSTVVQKKSSKVLAASAPAIPSDLATPQQLKAAVDRTSVSKIPSQGVGREIEAPKGAKRKLSSTEMPTPASTQPQLQPQHQPRPPPHDGGPPKPPPHKKKKKETSIFIPKKVRCVQTKVFCLTDKSIAARGR